MRPLKLVMTGFESYKDRTEINFEDLGQKGLYLIAGDTGAGKTTIFDAITFALYGSPSGTDRSVEMLRSHFADENTPTEVELVFEANGKKFEVKRNPDYERKARRGAGTTMESASAVLTYLSETKDPVSGLSKVTEAVEEILNLKKDQFCRIAMIAQGGFQKLLLSKKDEKEKIFRELFHTEKYNELQLRLKTDSKNASEKLDGLKKDLKNALERIIVFESDENFEDLCRIKESSYVQVAELDSLKAFVSKDEGIVDGIKKSLSKIDGDIEKINKELQAGETRKGIEDQISKLNKSLGIKEEELVDLESNVSSATADSKAVPGLEKDKNLLEESFNKYEEIEAIEKEIGSLTNSIRKKSEQLASLQKSEKKSSEKLEAYKQEVDGLKNAGENIVALENQLKDISSEKKELKGMISEIESLLHARNEYDLAKDNAKKANDDYVKANESYGEKIRLFNLEQAGILAESLKEGLPCPVCGSIEHPHPASKSAKAPTQQEIEEEKNNVDKLSKCASDSSNDCGQKKTVVEMKETALDVLLKKHFESLTSKDDGLSDKINEKLSQLEEQTDAVNDKLKNERNSKTRREELDVEIPNLSSEIKSISDSIQSLSIAISADTSTKNEKEINLAEKKSSLVYGSLEEAKEELKNLDDKIKTLRDELDEAINAKTECVNAIASIKGSISGLDEQLKKIDPVDMEKVQQKRGELINKKFALENQRDAMIERKGVNSGSVKTIEELLPKLSIADDRLKMISALCEVAVGTGRGRNGRPSLENYVQMVCLDRINRRANLRLKTMTDNKYELRRRIEEDGSELGLDLNVKDFYTGRERAVHTLSGGEQFQASLSLALGLADEIQASSGGIKLDAMFIDEGFGTLDGDTLNKAMKALEDLSQGNKLVGIISHVDELESRIPKKIYVKKDEYGISHTTMVRD